MLERIQIINRDNYLIQERKYVDLLTKFKYIYFLILFEYLYHFQTCLEFLNTNSELNDLDNCFNKSLI